MTEPRPALAIGLVALLAWVAWSTGVRLTPGWTADDGVHLQFATAYPLAEVLVRPELLKLASYANFTPMLNLFYASNLAFFGLDPSGFRLVMSLVAVLTVLLFYVAAALYMRASLALLAAAVFVLSVPFFYTTATFMTNHYLIGMACALGSVIAFRRWLDRAGGMALALSVVLYAAAVLSKEVYVPLLALIAWQPPFRRAVAGLVPFAFVLLGYFALRHLVLGSYVGGYRGGQLLSLSDWSVVLPRLAELPSIAFGGSARALLVLVPLVALLAFAGAGARLFLLVALAAVVVPLTALAAAAPFYEPDRYLFALMAVMAFLFGLASESVLRLRRLPRWVAYLACLVPILAIGRQFGERTPELVERLGEQSALFAEALRRDQPMVILNPGLPADDAYWSHSLNSMREAKARTLGTERPRPVLVVSDPASPILYEAADKPFGAFRLDRQGCRCLVPYVRTGADSGPLQTRFEPGRIHLQPMPDPPARPNGAPWAVARSVETSRSILPTRPQTLVVEGAIDVAFELPDLYVILPFDRRPTASIRAIEAAATLAPGTPMRAFRLELDFGDAALAMRAKDAACIAAPAVLDRPYALLRGQPRHCDLLVERVSSAPVRP